MSHRQPAVADTASGQLLRAALKSQYHAALAMLREAIERCPGGLWSSDERKNPFWWIAYHALHYTHLYIQPSESAFRPWEHDQPGLPDLDEPLETFRSYTKAELLAYWTFCDEMVDDTVDGLDLLDPESGFSWKKTSRAEHQIASIRHIQHHTAQLTDRLRAAANVGIDWVGSRPDATTE